VIDSELDAIYTHLCKTMTDLGEPKALAVSRLVSRYWPSTGWMTEKRHFN
jgi:hypothetical protein